MYKCTSLVQPILPEETLEVSIAPKQFDDGRNRLDENDIKENLCRQEIDHDLFNQADLIDYNQVGSLKDFFMRSSEVKNIKQKSENMNHIISTHSLLKVNHYFTDSM